MIRCRTAETLFMNITPLINATESLDQAFELTFDPLERKEIALLADGVKKHLRKRGVFMGYSKNMLALLPKEEPA